MYRLPILNAEAEALASRGVLEVEGMAGLVSRMLAEGKAEGRAEGEAKGRAEDVLLVLGERFGEVPAGLAERIRGQQDLSTLRQWMIVALRVPSLADFERDSRMMVKSPKV